MGASILRHRFRYVAVGLLSTVLLSIGSAMARADEPVILDFVRHGESGDMSVINTLVPGPHLTPTGAVQADAVAQALYGQYGNNIDGVFASTMIRSQETAQPLADLLHTSVQVLPGLQEIDAGIFEGLPVGIGNVPIIGALYLLAPAMWTLGFYFVPELGSSDFNGMEFEDRVNGAVQTIYDSTASNGDGNVTDTVFSHEGTIAIWTLMNVTNPDFPLVIVGLLTREEVLPYTGIVEVQGDPEDGWTLISWDGQQVPQDPGLATDLFVDARSVITAAPNGGVQPLGVRPHRRAGRDRERAPGRCRRNRHGNSQFPARGEY